VGQVLTPAVGSPHQSKGRGVRQGRGVYMAQTPTWGCLLKDAVHVCSFHWRVDTLTTIYSPRINIRPLSFLFLRCLPTPTTRLLALIRKRYFAGMGLYDDPRRFCHAESRVVGSRIPQPSQRLTSNPCISCLPCLSVRNKPRHAYKREQTAVPPVPEFLLRASR
jgi:hypothetical protein